jgi:tetratricopeptide (TPR) repeat protein
MAQRPLSQWLGEAEGLLTAGDPEQALRIATAILDRYPLHLQAHRTAAAAYLALGRLSAAREGYAQCLEFDPEDAQAYTGLGLILEANGDRAGAAAQYRRALEVAPGYADAGRHLGRVDPAAPTVRTRAWLARVYLRGGLLEHAAAELRYLLRQGPERLDLLLSLGYALWLAERRGEAADVCNAVLLQRPHCLKALLLLGELWVNGDRIQEGRVLLEQAGELDPEYCLARRLFADLPPGRLTLPEALLVLDLDLEQSVPAAPVAVPAVPVIEPGPAEAAVQAVEEVAMPPEPVAPVHEGTVPAATSGGTMAETVPAAAAPPEPGLPGLAEEPVPVPAPPPPEHVEPPQPPAQEAAALAARAEAALAGQAVAAEDLHALARSLARLLDEQGEDPYLRRLLGAVYHRLGEYEAAIDQYGRALRLMRGTLETAGTG